MTPSERERRIEAATKVLYGHRVHSAGASCATLAREALDAADEAVPVVSVEESERRHVERMAPAVEALADANGRAERAEAAARDLVEAVKTAIPRVQISGRETRHRFGYLRELDDVIVTMPAEDWSRIVALACLSFSGEEGTERHLSLDGDPPGPQPPKPPSKSPHPNRA